MSRFEELLAPVDADLREHFPVEFRPGQPPHTVYVSGAEASGDVARDWGERARGILDDHREQLESLADPALVDRVAARLADRPITDLRFDFEDGYGWRGDDTEDADARKAGEALRDLAAAPDGPASLGIRPKGLAAHERGRFARTLELLVESAGGVPAGFVFTVPKFRHTDQVPAVVAFCEDFEADHGLAPGTLRFELQIESPQAVVGADGSVPVARALHLSGGRCTGLHYGTYDFSAACGIAPQHQTLEHPVADFAKTAMLVAAAQTGVWVSDGSTQVVPAGDRAQRADALENHHRLVRRSLAHGLYQGWDMHPGHLVTRWLATFAFYRDALEAAAPRLENYLARQSGGIVDEPATAQALATVVLRGLDSGAFDPEDLLQLAPGCDRGTLEELVLRQQPGH